jgi:hypothetical protein
MNALDRCSAGLMSCPDRRPECPVLNQYLFDRGDLGRCRAFIHEAEPEATS